MGHWQATMWSWWAQVGGSGEAAPRGLAQAFELSPLFLLWSLFFLLLPLLLFFHLLACWRTYPKLTQERLLTYQRARQHLERLQGSLQEMLQPLRTRPER